MLHIQRETSTKVIINPPTAAESAWSPILLIGDPSKALSAFNMIKILVDGNITPNIPFPFVKMKCIFY